MSALRWLAALSFALVLPATAGTLYRCVGVDGIPNYSSVQVPDTVCKVVANTASTPSVPAFKPTDKPTTTLTNSAPVTSTAGAKPVVSNKRVEFHTAPAGSALPLVNAEKGAQVTRGAVYKYEADGITHYTNQRPKAATQAQVLFSYIETCYACGALPGVNFGVVALNTKAYSNEIQSAAKQYGVEESVVRAIIHAESAFHPNARSHKGAQGLMQLIPATASRFGVVNPYDPAQNIRGGVQYLSWLMRRYSSNLTLVAAAYNAGEGAVDRNGGVPPYAETQRYVQRVGQLADRYRTALAAP